MTDEHTMLLAYTGDVEARKTLDRWLSDKAKRVLVDYLPFPEWLSGLRPLVQEATECECDDRHKNKFHDRCCQGTGKTTTPSHPWLRLAIASAWAVWKEILHARFHETPFEHDCHDCLPALSIRAAEAWLKEPTAEHQKAWDDACAALSEEQQAGVTFWLPVPYVSQEIYRNDIKHAAKTSGPEAVRTAIRDEVQTWSK